MPRNLSKKKTCTYKMYLTKDAAYCAARKQWKTKQFRVYKCNFCSGWHLARHKESRMDFLFEQIKKENLK